ncbi:MAG: hypothetical protein WD059_05735 [Balneolaceae bacterium]
MAVLKILFGSIAGTSLMTLFSYLMAYELNRQFKEPELLNELLFQSYFYESSGKPTAAGWLLHYLIGIIFVTCFHFFWMLTVVEPTFFSGTLLGLASGFIGISGWHLTFRIHHKPPSINLSTYYFHLLAAHIIFGWGAAAGYNLLKFK